MTVFAPGELVGIDTLPPLQIIFCSVKSFAVAGSYKPLIAPYFSLTTDNPCILDKALFVVGVVSVLRTL